MKYLRNLLILMFFLPVTAWAQEDFSMEEELDSAYIDIRERMLLYQEELMQLNAVSRFQINIDSEMPLTEPLVNAVSERLKSVKAAMNSFSVRWDTYSQAQQVYIADNDSLLNKMAEIQQMQQAVTDTLEVRERQCEQLAAFIKAEAFIWGQDKNYRQLYQQAVQCSLSPKLAAKLEKVKAEEQNTFADIQTHYDQAKEAAAAFPGLQLRMQGIDTKFIELQSASAKIQEMAYKPFIQRIKDYLLGMAAVAVLLMFFNLLTSKIKMLKQAREQAKKMKDMMNGQKYYPTI